MVDPRRSPEADDGPGREPSHGSPSGEPPTMPRWVKVSAVVVGVVIVLFVILQLTGIGGSHGPGRHSGAGRPAMVSGVDLRVVPGGGPQGRQAGESSYR
jgi:hypothetical protein